MEAHTVIKELKGGSFSATRVIELDDKEKRVRKSVSSSENREYGLVRWQSQVRRMQHLHSVLPEHSPPVLSMGVSDTDFYYEIPYYESSQNLFEYLSERGKPEAITLFDDLTDVIEAYSQISYGEVRGSFSVFFSEEVLGRVKNIDAQMEMACSLGSITEDELVFAKDRIERIYPLLSQVLSDTKSLPILESLTHGNLTLENALYDHESESIILIDPYSETYSESVLGDYSQLMQSSVSRYEEIVSGGEASISSFFEAPKGSNKNGVYYFGERVREHVGQLSINDQRIVMLFHAAQFVRMFPFKIEKTPRLAIYFLLHGLSIFEEESHLC